MIDHAERYSENEWHIFPLAARTKIPQKDSNGLDDANIEMAGDWRDASNIGCNAGKSGVFCLDVDLLNRKTIKNPFLAQIDETVSSEISQAPRLITPSGGEQFLFRCEVDEFPSTAGTIAPGVDTRCLGGYFLLPPSKTRDGSYKWDCAEVPDCPSDLPEMSSALREFISEGLQNKKHQKKVDFSNVVIEEGSRNDSLYRLGCKLRRVGFSSDEILNALNVANAQRCNPPVSDREIKNIAEQSSKHDQDDFATAMMDSKISSNVIDLTGILGKVRDEDTSLSYEEAEDESEDVDDLNSGMDFNLPGVAGMMYREILDSAIYPSKALAFGGAMVGFSGLIERKWSGPLDGRANLEVVCLADSGSGKDHPRKWVSSLYRELEIDDKVCNVSASKEGLEDYLSTHPAIVSLADEADGMLASLKNTNDKLARSLWDYRLELYSSSSSHIRTRLRANGSGGQIIINPFFSVLSSAIPSMFFLALTEATIFKGLVPRCIVLDAGKRGRANRNPSKVQPSKELIKECKKFLNANSGGNLEDTSSAKPKTTSLDFSDGAREFYFDQIVDEADKRHDALKARGRKDYVLWSRVGENTMKLALLYSLSKDGAKAKEISRESMEWGWRIASGAVEGIQGRINNVGNGKDSENMNKIKELIKSAKDKTLSHREILRATNMKKRDLDDYLETLVEAGVLSMGERKNQHGRPSVIFSA